MTAEISRRPARQRDEPVDAERVAGARRNAALERLEESLVDRVDREPALSPRGLVTQQARSLLVGVRQLAEPVAELDPGDVELEALRDARVSGLLARERRLRGRVVCEEDRVVERGEAGLDRCRP